MEQITLQLAQARGAELRTEAARFHLARLAACCQPSTWVGWLRRHVAPAA